MIKFIKSLFSKKKEKKTYKLSEFSKRRNYRGRTQVYHDDSGEWIMWYLIASGVSDEDGIEVSETEMSSYCELSSPVSNNDSYTSSHDTSYSSGGGGYSGYSGSSNDSYSSGGSSSYDGGSSYSSSDSSSSSSSFGGGCE